LATAFFPPFYFLRVEHVPVRAVLLGAVTWAAAVAVKHPLAAGLNRLFGTKKSDRLLAFLQGLLSAALELTAAAAGFRLLSEERLADVLAFGSAAGAIEVVYVLALGSRAQRDAAREAEWARGAAVSVCVRYQTAIERFFALVGHTGSRGVVYAAMHLPFMRAIALLTAVLCTFTAIDGVAYYGHLRKWNWLAPAVCVRAHSFFAGVSLIELALCLISFSWLPK
jgi:hypothetical protein